MYTNMKTISALCYFKLPPKCLNHDRPINTIWFYDQLSWNINVWQILYSRTQTLISSLTGDKP